VQSKRIGILPEFVPWGAPKGEVHRGGTAASPGHSPVERNAPTAEQLLRWSPVPGSVRGEPGTNYRAQKNTLSMIGKGKRSQEVKGACMKYKAVYFGATGGAGALIAKRIKKAEVIAYPELGPEAIRKLEVEDFPVTVVNDSYGGDLYEEGRKKWAKA